MTEPQTLTDMEVVEAAISFLASISERGSPLAKFLTHFEPPYVKQMLEENARLRGALAGLYELCMHANADAFSNGVTDSTGTIDQGDVWASEYLERARAALSTEKPS